MKKNKKILFVLDIVLIKWIWILSQFILIWFLICFSYNKAKFSNLIRSSYRTQVFDFHNCCMGTKHQKAIWMLVRMFGSSYYVCVLYDDFDFLLASFSVFSFIWLYFTFFILIIFIYMIWFFFILLDFMYSNLFCHFLLVHH